MNCLIKVSCSNNNNNNQKLTTNHALRVLALVFESLLFENYLFIDTTVQYSTVIADNINNNIS